jgi:hypothetical protein
MSCSSINCITNFFCCSSPEEPLLSFREKMEEMRATRLEACRSAHESGSNLFYVIILGAGPAGLFRAIQALLTFTKVEVREKRGEDVNGRENTVLLKAAAIDLLKEYGIYQYLLEHRQIYPEQNDLLNVRITDLEHAMREVIRELMIGEPSPIQYQTELVEMIERVDETALLRLRQIHPRHGSCIDQVSPDIVVVATGQKGSQSLIERRTTLDPLPVINAIFTDGRPEVTDLPTFIEYMAKSLYYLAVTIYIHVIGFFKILCGMSYVVASVSLATPGQVYLGCGLSPEGTERLIRLNEEIQDLEQNPDDDGLHLRLLKQERENFLHEAALDGLVRSNYLNLLIRVSQCLGGPPPPIVRPLDFLSWLPLNSTNVIEIGADAANHAAWMWGKTAFLMAGDALNTVEPTTGDGCNNALTSSVVFDHFLMRLQEGEPMESLVDAYRRSAQELAARGNQESRRMRRLYRPDTLTS